MAKNAAQFLREVKQEGRKVTWPGRKEVMITTVIVFIMVVIVAAYLMLADFFIAAIIETILGIGN